MTVTDVALLSGLLTLGYVCRGVLMEKPKRLRSIDNEQEG